MRNWKPVRVDAGIEVCFCDPHAPWQRSSNENTNGLLRQYFPKGTELAAVTQAQLDAVADELNDQPRKQLGFPMPTEQLAELLLQDRSNPPIRVRHMIARLNAGGTTLAHVADRSDSTVDP